LYIFKSTEVWRGYRALAALFGQKFVIWRTAGHAVLLWSLALPSQGVQGWVPLESEPLWMQLVELTTEAASATTPERG
jgi:hypothetical protein